MEILKKLCNRNAQNAVEYLLIFSAVVIVVMLALAPNGWFTNSIDQSIDDAVTAIENMANTVQ